MKQVFVKYYLPIFLIVLTFILPVIAVNYNSGELLKMITALSILSLLLTLILGTFNYKFGDKLEVKQKKKQLNKKLFQQFINNGFDDNEVSIFGYIDNYYIIISTEKDSFQPKKWIKINILFNPKQQNQFIPNYIFENLYKLKKKNYSWNSNSLKIEKIYGFRLPKYTVIKNIIEEAIQVLKQNNIESMSVENWNLSINESINYHKQISKLKS